MRDLSQYPFNIRSLNEEESGGFLITFPDFSDCISDGETPEEAIHNRMDALRETIAALKEYGVHVGAVREPPLFSLNGKSGKVALLPISLILSDSNENLRRAFFP